jgi:hypothetical protein
MKKCVWKPCILRIEASVKVNDQLVIDDLNRETIGCPFQSGASWFGRAQSIRITVKADRRRSPIDPLGRKVEPMRALVDLVLGFASDISLFSGRMQTGWPKDNDNDCIFGRQGKAHLAWIASDFQQMGASILRFVNHHCKRATPVIGEQ